MVRGAINDFFFLVKSGILATLMELSYVWLCGVAEIDNLFKCRYDQIFDMNFFYIFVHSRSSVDIFPIFNLLRSIERTFFGPLSL